jgi:hypothetical protein
MQSGNTAFPSTADARTRNNTLRHTYRALSDVEKAHMSCIKDAGATFIDILDHIEQTGRVMRPGEAPAGESREFEIARQKIEEAVMWAVKQITA